MSGVGASHLALVGPTASGKSALALDVAKQLGDVEIVSVDSMQVYRGLDVGTAKPTAEERAVVPHHLLDVADPGEEFTAARFQAAARAAVAGIEARGNRALLVGGTGLYVQAVVDDLCFPGEDLDLRAALEARSAEPGGVAALHAELAAADPVAAARIDPHNVRRIVRALEVVRCTGRPFSALGPGLDQYGPTAFPVRMAGVWLPRPVLAARIDARVAGMLDAGLVDEARRLLAAGRPLSRTAAQAIGYREALEHLEGGLPLPEARDRIVRRTRSLARRQRMWFRRDPRVRWLAAADDPERLGPALLATWSR